MPVTNVRANETVVLRHPGHGMFACVKEGDLYLSDDPMVAAYGWLFSDDAQRPVEQATANPGTRRGGLRR